MADGEELEVGILSLILGWSYVLICVFERRKIHR